MQTVKSRVALAVITFGLIFFYSGPMADANLVQDGTYFFSSTAADTALGGNSVTFSREQIVGWNLLDALAAPYDPLPPTTIPLNPGNSFIVSSGVLVPNFSDALRLFDIAVMAVSAAIILSNVETLRWSDVPFPVFLSI